MALPALLNPETRPLVGYAILVAYGLYHIKIPSCLTYLKKFNIFISQYHLLSSFYLAMH